MDDLKQLKLVKNIYIVMSLLFCVLGIFLMAKAQKLCKNAVRAHGNHADPVRSY